MNPFQTIAQVYRIKVSLHSHVHVSIVILIVVWSLDVAILSDDKYVKNGSMLFVGIPFY